MKILLLFFILIISISYCSALQIGISPPRINFTGFVNEDLCNFIKIKSDYRGELNGEIKFGENQYVENKIENFKVKPENLEINIIYPKTFIMSENMKEIKICLKSGNELKTKGVLLYYPREGYAGVGSFIYVNINSNPFKKNILIGLAVMQTLLISELFIVLFLKNKSTKESSK